MAHGVMRPRPDRVTGPTMEEISGVPRPTYRPRPPIASMPVDVGREHRSHVRADGGVKICFEAFEDAEVERDRMNGRRREGDPWIGIYQCWMRPVHFHLGSENPAQPRRAS